MRCGVWLLFLLLCAPARAATLEPGLIETSLSGHWTSVSGTSRGGVDLSAAWFTPGPGGLWALEILTGYQHVQSLDVWENEFGVQWIPRLGEGSTFLFAGLAAGWRQEWIGSFEEARFPVGITAGMRGLVGESAGIRAEYRYRRILGDPVSDHDEHRLQMGLAIYWNR